MRHDHLKRELDLLLLLAQNRLLSTADICRRTGISLRSFYYYIDFFEQAGFRIEKHHGMYSIDRTSPFFMRLGEIIHFTEDEALLMRRLIDCSGDETLRLRDLKAKLERFYDFKILADEQLRERTAHVRSVIYEAVKLRHVVELRGYSSPSSHTVSDRRVEPFQFLGNGNDVRCYEPATGLSKTFRISRMADAVDTGEQWQHADKHRQAYIDLFSFTGEDTMHITLRMGQLSHNLMLEEYPASAGCFSMAADGRWIFQADVCSYLGIGRFVLGLYDDIEILGDDGLKQYVTGKLQQWHSCLSSSLAAPKQQ